MPEACVLHFTYSDPPKCETDWRGYVKAVATQLAVRLEEHMAVQRKAPLLFIAHGLGGLVVQEAAIQRASGLNILQETDVGYIFLNTSFPNYQGSDRWDNDKYGLFSFIQRTRRYDFVERALASEGGFSNGRLWMEFVNADLFTGLGLRDVSMANQHREGFTSPFNYFFAKAEQYAQTKIMYSDIHPDKWPATPISGSSTPEKREQRAVAVFMPILSFETKDNLDKLDKPIQAVARGEFPEVDNLQIELAKAYIGQESYPHGLHPRRPLDQFSYTSRREEQIMPNLGRKPDNKPMGTAAALMVDQDEMNIVKTVVKQQEGVIDQLSRAISAFHQNSRHRHWKSNGDELANTSPVGGSLDLYEIEEEQDMKPDGDRNRDGLQKSIMTSVKDSLRVLKGMLEYAGQIERNIDHLLDLKHKQANALEARYAREGSDQSHRQGNIMLYWTTITIIFLPMSFLSSFFMINISEFVKDAGGTTSWPLRNLSGYLFGILFALILPLLLIGFLLRPTPFTLAERTRLQSLSKKHANHDKHGDKVQSANASDEGTKHERAESEDSIGSNSKTSVSTSFDRSRDPLASFKMPGAGTLPPENSHSTS
ncbi:hypothetical protein BJX68DRAFT_270638 [Aspergillus pseudodeflectus]|uniref:Uncharacterized protein n=1 Tax=Aspergillus pseudodeflectus TaxID=176178 RepID=A0ABR4JR08_9EURO